MKLILTFYLFVYMNMTYSSLSTSIVSCDPNLNGYPLAHSKINMMESFIKYTEGSKALPKTVDPSKDSSVILNIAQSSSQIEWKNEYTDFLYKTLSGPSFDILLSQKIEPADLEKMNCTNFNELNNDEKKKFYIVYLAAISEASSDYDSKNESYSKSDKTTNYGLLQIDPQSAIRHAGSVIGKSVGKEELTNYETNLQVGAYILKHQIAGKIATGRLFPKNAYYWPSLKSSQKRILKTVKKNSANLPFCKSTNAENAVEEKAVEEKKPAEKVNIGTDAKKRSQSELTLKSSDKSDAPAQRQSSSKRAQAEKRVARNQASSEEPTASRNLDSKTLHVEAFESRLKSLGTGSQGMCAQGVRKSLNALFGDGPDNGPNAKNYSEDFLQHWRTENLCYKYDKDNSAPRNYDVRVLEGNASPTYGHIEIYYNGRWYSDFQQGASLWDNGLNSFDKKRVYRLSDCSKRTSFINQYLLKFKRFLISSNVQSFSTKSQSNEL